MWRQSFKSLLNPRTNKNYEVINNKETVIVIKLTGSLTTKPSVGYLADMSAKTLQERFSGDLSKRGFIVNLNRRMQPVNCTELSEVQYKQLLTDFSF